MVSLTVLIKDKEYDIISVESKRGSYARLWESPAKLTQTLQYDTERIG
ncbi:MAG: hypothetical protein ACI4MS_01300 [Candidatus Coproplasma sp.]